MALLNLIRMVTLTSQPLQRNGRWVSAWASDIVHVEYGRFSFFLEGLEGRRL